jgi:hypothetical protein
MPELNKTMSKLKLDKECAFFNGNQVERHEFHFVVALLHNVAGFSE